MATLRINDYFDLGTKGYHNASSWQIALDPGFNQIIDQSLNDTVNVKEWKTMLPKIGGGGYYADLNNLYARIKIHIDNTVSGWFVLAPKNQNNQPVIYTENGVTVRTVNSLDINLN